PHTTSSLSLHDALPIYPQLPCAAVAGSRVRRDGALLLSSHAAELQSPRRTDDGARPRSAPGRLGAAGRPGGVPNPTGAQRLALGDRKSTRLNSSHVSIS